VTTEQIVVEDADVAWLALSDLKASKADFADCLIGRRNVHAGCDATATLDARLKACLALQRCRQCAGSSPAAGVAWTIPAWGRRRQLAPREPPVAGAVVRGALSARARASRAAAMAALAQAIASWARATILPGGRAVGAPVGRVPRCAPSPRAWRTRRVQSSSSSSSG